MFHGNLAKLPFSTADESDIMHNIRHLLQVAVKKRMMAERRIGCLLSGKVYLLKTAVLI